MTARGSQPSPPRASGNPTWPPVSGNAAVIAGGSAGAAGRAAGGAIIREFLRGFAALPDDVSAADARTEVQRLMCKVSGSGNRYVRANASL